jgi:hypothetical protein
MVQLLKCARILGLELCPSLTRKPGIRRGILYYRPATKTETRRQLARILAAHVARLS